MADDFVYASNARNGFWSAWLQEYVGWNGRYASNVLVLNAPVMLGLAGYRGAAIVMLVSAVAAVYLFVRALAGDGLTRSEALTCCLTFAALYLSQAPSLGESIYWYTSAATYHVPLILALLHLTLIIRYVRRRHPAIGDRLGLAFAAVLLVGAVGSNEVMMLMMLALYAMWFLWSIQEGGTRRILSGGFLLVTIASALAVVLSPGNAVRRSMYPAVAHHLAHSFGMTALQTLRFSSEWVSSGALLLATVLFLPMAEKWSRRRPQNPHRVTQYLWLLAAGLLLVIPIAVFPAYWETSVLGQHRTVNMAYFAFLILWFIAAAMWVMSGSAKSSIVRAFGDELRLPLALLLLAALALTRNSYALGSDFVSGRLAGFDLEMDRRYAALRACQERGDRTCVIEPIQNKPASFVVLDVSADPSDYVNVAYARYFGLAEVRLIPAGGSIDRAP